MNNPRIAEYQPNLRLDWADHPPREPIIDQSTHLPYLIPDFIIPTALSSLREPEDFEIWLCEAKAILHEWSMDALVDIRVPRPNTSSIGAESWRVYSLMVRDWLAGNMSWKMYTTVLDRGYRIDFADEFVLNARLAFQTMTQITLLTNDVLYLARANYLTATRFVGAFQWNFAVAWNAGIDIKPQLALARLFMELRQDVPQLVQQITANIDTRGDVWGSLSFDEVLAICSYIVDALKGK